MSKEKKSGGAKRPLLMILLVLITLGACGFAGYSYWKLKQQAAAPQTAIAEQTPPVVVAEPIFLALDPFTVNLTGDADADERVLYVGFTLNLPDSDTQARLLKYLPEVRSRLLLLLSHQKQSAMQTEQGKQALVQLIKQTLQPPFAPGLPEQQIHDVLFTTFILR